MRFIVEAQVSELVGDKEHAVSLVLGTLERKVIEMDEYDQPVEDYLTTISCGGDKVTITGWTVEAEPRPDDSPKGIGFVKTR